MGLFGFFKGIINIFNPNYIVYGANGLFPDHFDYTYHAGQGEWDQVNDRFNALHYSEQENLITKVGQKMAKKVNPFAKWQDKDPDGYYYNLFQASYLIERAWEFRGGGTADSVSDENFNNFHSLIEMAEICLQKAADCPEVTGHVYSLMMVVHLCLSDPLENSFETLDLMRQLDTERALPVNLCGHVTLLNATCEKWLGSHEEMFTFAREYAFKDKGHGYMASLICYAHLQRWLYYKAFDEDDASADVYFDQEDVRQELMAAHQWATENFNPESSGFNIIADNMFAGILSWAGLTAEAKDYFGRMGKRALEFPWMYIGIKKLNEYRDIHRKS